MCLVASAAVWCAMALSVSSAKWLWLPYHPVECHVHGRSPATELLSHENYGKTNHKLQNVHEISDISEISMTFQKSLTSASASACFVGAPQAMCESTTIKVGLSCLVSLEAKTIWIFPTIGVSRKIPSALTPHFHYINLTGLILGGIPFSDTWVSNSRLKLRKARVRACVALVDLVVPGLAPKWSPPKMVLDPKTLRIINVSQFYLSGDLAYWK